MCLVCGIDGWNVVVYFLAHDNSAFFLSLFELLIVCVSLCGSSTRFAFFSLTPPCFDPPESPSASPTWLRQSTRQNTDRGRRHGPAPNGQGGPSVPAGGVQRRDKQRQRHCVPEYEQFVRGERAPQQRDRVAEPESGPGRRACSEPAAVQRAGRGHPETKRPRILLLHPSHSRRRGWCSTPLLGRLNFRGGWWSSKVSCLWVSAFLCRLTVTLSSLWWHLIHVCSRFCNS